MNIKKGDRLPAFAVTLVQADGSAIDLTNASTVRLYMRNLDTGTLKVNGVACVVENAAAGLVRYDWSAADTDTTGAYAAEFEITFVDSRKMTVPTRGALAVNVLENVA